MNESELIGYAAVIGFVLIVGFFYNLGSKEAAPNEDLGTTVGRGVMKLAVPIIRILWILSFFD